MFDLPQNTIFTYLSNPMFDKMDFSALPVSTLASEIKKFQNQNKKMASPETDALKFYFLNHAFHIMKSKFNHLEGLDEQMIHVAEKHIQLTNEIAKRLFCYSIIIAVEEARFIGSQEQKFYDLIERSYGDEFLNYVKGGFKGSLTDFGKLDMTCGEYASAMVAVFAFGKWSPGFGGKGWTPIASLASDCIHGVISFEGMADQAFSLSHNNGSMFNKGHLYSHYSQFIYTILDIQDSGQIPQWISSNKNSQYVDKELKDIFEILEKHFPDEMTGKVDQSLIKNSQKKRDQKAAALAKQHQATWNNFHNAPSSKEPKAPPQSKMDAILMGDFKKGLL